MKKIAVGKWYLVIGNMCLGFGTPPAKYYEMRINNDGGDDE